MSTVYVSLMNEAGDGPVRDLRSHFRRPHLAHSEHELLQSLLGPAQAPLHLRVPEQEIPALPQGISTVYQCGSSDHVMENESSDTQGRSDFNLLRHLAETSSKPLFFCSPQLLC